MKHLAPLTILLGSIAVACAADAPPVEDYRFKVEKLLGGIPQPMELEFAPDGRLFINEYQGALKIYHPDTKQVTVAATLQVFNGLENGFLGFALDPKFAENHWIYCLYSPKGFNGQYLSRFTMQGDTMDITSEKKLLQYDEQRLECCHHGASVEFGPDGNLYWSAGDNTNPFGDSLGYAPIDQRPGKEPWDAERSAGSTNSLAGKINRIHPLPDGTYEIPKGNLFPVGTPKTRPEIFVMGCRNPWRMSIDERTGYVYWGEVGPDAGGDGPRGPRGYDEINQARQAGNFGWPLFVANNQAYARYDYTSKQVGAKFDAGKPLNESPNNTGLRELPPAMPAFIYWPYGGSKEFPEIPNAGGRTACAGPVYYSAADVEKTNGFPAKFNHCLLFWDWERPFMKWARLDENSNLVGIEPFTSAVVLGNKAEQIEKAKPQVSAGATLVKRPVDATFGKDGCLYLLDYGETWGANADAQLLKISYIRGNLPPVAHATVTPDSGREPLTVTLSAEGSRDPEGDALKYEWVVLPGGKPFAAPEKSTVKLDKPGNYTLELHAIDGKGAVGTTSVPVVVGNTTPTVKFEQPRDGDFFTPGKPVAYRVSVSDPEDGPSSAKPEEFGMRTLVSSAFQRADGKEDAIDPGLSRMKQSDCFNCHAVETKVVGPALVDVAAKYRGQAGAIDASIKRVREGSQGVWGPIPMLAHPQHTPDEVAIMLHWVFSLEKGKGGPVLARGLTGEVTAPKQDKPGVFVLEAAYTDAGRPPAAPLSNKVRVTLLSRRVEAESADRDMDKGPKELTLTGASGKKGIGAINDGHSLKFPSLNLADSKTVTVRWSSGGSGGKIELHAGTPKGALLASVDAPVTGGWDKWQEATVPLAPTTAPTDVCVVFTNPGKGGLMNLDWVQFNQ